MQIFVMRHGEASNVCFTTDHCDALRPLTKHGKEEVKEMAIWLANNNHLAVEILVSPYLRAQQTCEQVIKILKQFNPALSLHQTTLDEFTPNGDAQQAQDYIDGSSNLLDESKKVVLIISHMPLVSYLVAKLTHDQHSPIFPTAAIAQINYDDVQMQGDLVALVSPRHC